MWCHGDGVGGCDTQRLIVNGCFKPYGDPPHSFTLWRTLMCVLDTCEDGAFWSTIGEPLLIGRIGRGEDQECWSKLLIDVYPPMGLIRCKACNIMAGESGGLATSVVIYARMEGREQKRKGWAFFKKERMGQTKPIGVLMERVKKRGTLSRAPMGRMDAKGVDQVNGFFLFRP